MLAEQHRCSRLCMAVTPSSRVAQIHAGDEISLQGQVSITLSYLIKAHESKHGDTGQFITIWCLLLLVAVHLLLCPAYIFNFLITVCIEEHTGRLGVPTILSLTSTDSPSHSLFCPRAAGRQRLWLKPAQQRLQVSPQVWCWHLHRNLSMKATHV